MVRVDLLARPPVRILLTSLIAVGIVALLPQQRMQYATQAFLVRWRPPAARPDPRITIVAMDDETLADESIPQFIPGVLRRSAHAKVTRELVEGGAKVIGFDIAFLGSTNAADDEALRREIERANSVVLVVQAKANAKNRAERFEEPLPLLSGAASVRLSSPLVRRAAATGEVLGITLEQNRADGRTLNAFAFECYKAFTAADDLGASHTYDTVGSEAMMTPRWPGAPVEKAFETVSYRDVWSGEARKRDPERFRDRMVLIGSTATVGATDTLKTPAGDVPGVIVHAAAAQTLLNRDWIREQGMLGGWVLTLLLCLMASSAGYLLKPFLSFAGVAASVGLALFAGVYFFVQQRQWINFMPAAVGAPLAWMLAVSMRAWFARRMLERFAGVDAAGQLEATGGLRARTQTATILFADVRGYTDLSERLNPAELMDVLNEHFQWMDGVVARHGGRVDKHMGDAMMAVFEPRRGKPDHAARALAAAREMVACASQRKGPAAELEFGIGIHTGEISTGALGRGKLEYGSVGDAVNVAARLQQSSASVGAIVLVSEEAYRDAGEPEGFRAMEPMTLKGRSEPVSVFTLC